MPSPSDIFYNIRAHRGDWLLVESDAAHALAFQEPHRVLFILQLEGSVVVTSGGDLTARLAPGDTLVVIRGSHLVGPSGGGLAPVDVPLSDQASVGEPDAPARLRIGAGPPCFTVLAGAVDIRVPAGLQVDLLPDAIQLQMAVEQRQTQATVAIMRRAIGGPGASAYMTRMAELFFLRGLREHPALLDRISTSGPCLQIAQAMRAIQEDPARAWTVAAMARTAGMSRSAFAARFAAVVGRTPMDVLARVRLNLAMRLLNDPRLGIAEVGFRAGYVSTSAFIKRFRALTGHSPGQFRKTLREEGNAIRLQITAHSGLPL